MILPCRQWPRQNCAVCYVPGVSDHVALDHPRFVRAERAIFVKRVIAECMSHRCSLVHQGNRTKLDACCQYGVDVDSTERDAIIARRQEIADLLVPEVARHPWFTGPVTEDPDFPSGRYVRTSTHDDGCIFLAHDGRGCAIHRAAIAGGWDIRGVKPHVCRLFPLSYESDAIVLSDDYTDYSCAYAPDAPSVYRVGREALGDIFGADLVQALDRAETQVLGADTKLRVLL